MQSNIEIHKQYPDMYKAVVLNQGESVNFLEDMNPYALCNIESLIYKFTNKYICFWRAWNKGQLLKGGMIEKRLTTTSIKACSTCIFFVILVEWLWQSFLFHRWYCIPAFLENLNLRNHTTIIDAHATVGISFKMYCLGIRHTNMHIGSDCFSATLSAIYFFAKVFLLITTVNKIW